MNERITLKDNIMSAISKLSEGNPGGMTVCMKLLEDNQTDPDNMLGGLGVLLSLDALNIYGSKIWMLYKDVCKENLILTLSTLRAHQLGYLSREDLLFAIDNYGEGINITTLYNQVKEKLPKFDKDGKGRITTIS